jgi:hypothetical protein
MMVGFGGGNDEGRKLMEGGKTRERRRRKEHERREGREEGRRTKQCNGRTMKENGGREEGR